MDSNIIHMGSSDSDLMKQYPTLAMLASTAVDDYENGGQYHNSRHSSLYTSALTSHTPLNQSDGYIDEFTGVIKRPRMQSLLNPHKSTPLDKPLEHLRNVWKEVPNISPYHPQKSNLALAQANLANALAKSNVVLLVRKQREEEAPEVVESEEEFDYSIFLNKPVGLTKPVDITKPVDLTKPAASQEKTDADEVDTDVFIDSHIVSQEIVIGQEIISEEKVNSILSVNEAYFGNVCPKKADEDDEPDPAVYGCEFCSLKFKVRGNLTRHKMTHSVKSKSAPFRYQCKVCGRNFLQKCDLTRHMHVHDNTYPYECSICGNGYLRKRDLEVHTNFHTGERAHECDFTDPYTELKCPKAFFSKSDLSRHKRSVHNKTYGKLKCAHCERCFTLESTLLKHVQTEHNGMIIMAFKEQICKLQQMPSVVEVNAVPHQVDTLVSPVIVPVPRSSKSLTSADDDVIVTSSADGVFMCQGESLRVHTIEESTTTATLRQIPREVIENGRHSTCKDRVKTIQSNLWTAQKDNCGADDTTISVIGCTAGIVTDIS